MTRPLKVGEYRKVKTWDEIKGINGVVEGEPISFGGIFFNEYTLRITGKVIKIQQGFRYYDNDWDFNIPLAAEFFTDDYYDENGNEVKMEVEIKAGDVFRYINKTSDRFINGNKYRLRSYDKDSEYPFKISDLVSSVHTMKKDYFYTQFEMVTLDQWHNDLNPLDQLEVEANQTLAQISKLREIDLKQAEIDELIEAQNKRLDEIKKTGGNK